MVLLAANMILSDGVLTPAISVVRPAPLCPSLPLCMPGCPGLVLSILLLRSLPPFPQPPSPLLASSRARASLLNPLCIHSGRHHHRAHSPSRACPLPLCPQVSAVEGIEYQTGISRGTVVGIAVGILVCLFAVQPWGTQRVAVMFRCV